MAEPPSEVRTIQESHREIYSPEDADAGPNNYSNRFPGTFSGRIIYGALRKRGWSIGAR